MCWAPGMAGPSGVWPGLPNDGTVTPSNGTETLNQSLVTPSSISSRPPSFPKWTSHLSLQQLLFPSSKQDKGGYNLPGHCLPSPPLSIITKGPELNHLSVPPLELGLFSDPDPDAFCWAQVSEKTQKAVLGQGNDLPYTLCYQWLKMAAMGSIQRLNKNIIVSSCKIPWALGLSGSWISWATGCCSCR